MEAALGEPQPAPGPTLLSNRGHWLQQAPLFPHHPFPSFAMIKQARWYLFHPTKNAQKNVWKDACQTLTRRVPCAWNLAF